MLRSRVVLGLIGLASTLAFAGVANAHEDGMMMGPYYGSQSSNMDLFYLPARSHYASCYRVPARYHHGVLVSSRHWNCGMYSVRYVCAQTVTTVTPIHRDTYCSAWAMVRVSHHHWGRVNVYR